MVAARDTRIRPTESVPGQLLLRKEEVQDSADIIWIFCCILRWYPTSMWRISIGMMVLG